MAAYCNYARNSAGEMWFAAPGEIQLKKVTQQIGGAGDETGGRESKGRRDLMKLLKLFQNGKI